MSNPDLSVKAICHMNAASLRFPNKTPRQLAIALHSEGVITFSEKISIVNDGFEFSFVEDSAAVQLRSYMLAAQAESDDADRPTYVNRVAVHVLNCSPIRLEMFLQGADRALSRAQIAHGLRLIP